MPSRETSTFVFADLAGWTALTEAYGDADALRIVTDPVSVYRAQDVETGTPTLEIDPVCRMAVDPARAAAVRRGLEMTRYFCSTACASAFDARPRRYFAASAGARAARYGFLIDLGAFVVVGTAHVRASSSEERRTTSCR